MMSANPLVGFAVALAACILLVPTVHAQDVGDCPDNTCVESHTTLSYNPQTNMMDAYTTATTDYNTSYWYDLCVNLAVMRINGPYVANWDILLPSTTPSSCVSGVVELDEAGSVAATPGRQYFAEGLVELYVYYTYSEITYPDCGAYCNNYWYDAEGFSLLSTTPYPTNANWSSIDYSYPYLDEPVPSTGQSLAMNGSGATAWSPPVIYSVNGVAPPNEAQLPAGTTTTVTIRGVGFGYSPTLTITGTGITGFTNPCASSPSVQCDGTIVATVTIDASTPADTPETITVAAGGQNTSGYQPVDTGPDPYRQTTAQANTTVLKAPHIFFQGQDVTVLTQDQAHVAVVVGQQIALTVKIFDANGNDITNTADANGNQWSQPPGTVIGGFTLSNYTNVETPFGSTQSPQTATVVTLPAQQAGTCQTFKEQCLRFYWLDSGDSRSVSFSYKLNGVQSPVSKASFDVRGPAGVGLNATFGTAQITTGPRLQFGDPNGIPGVALAASAFVLPAAGPRARYQYVPLITGDRVTRVPYDSRTFSHSNPQVCSATTVGLDNFYPKPAASNLPPGSVSDSPSASLNSAYGELLRDFSVTEYLLWDPGLIYPADPNAPCTPAQTTATFASAATTCTSIPVPLMVISWEFKACAINTLTPQGGSTGQTWLVSCGQQNDNLSSSGTPVQLNAGNNYGYPQWTSIFTNAEAYKDQNGNICQ